MPQSWHYRYCYSSECVATWKDANELNIRAVIPVKVSLAPEGKSISFSVGEEAKPINNQWFTITP